MNHFKFNDGVRMLANLSRMPHEDAMFKLGRIDRPPVTDMFGNLDLRKFRDRARESHVSDLAICDEVSMLTGCSWKNVYYELKRIRIKK